MSASWIVPVLVAAGAAAGLAASTPGGRLVARVDPGASTVEITLGATAHTVHGSFRVKEGEIRVDPASGAAEGRIVIDAASGVTGNSSRDRTMHRTVLESAQYPEITFQPARVEGPLPAEGAAEIRLKGTFVLHGAAHDLVIPLHVTISGGQLDASGSFLVPYVAWGLHDPSFFVLRVDKQVTVQVRIRGTVGKP